MDVKRRKTQDFAQKADSTAAGTGNWDVEEPVEPNEEVGKPHFLSGKCCLPSCVISSVSPYVIV